MNLQRSHGLQGPVHKPHIPAQANSTRASNLYPVHTSANKIKDVWNSNLKFEFARLCKFAHDYPIIAIDTEFPGFLYDDLAVKSDSKEIRSFQRMVMNVREMKLIQLGVTLSDYGGNKPKDGGTWQFNFRFDINKDRHDCSVNGGVEIMKKTGVKFDLLKKHGISHDIFFDYLLRSGLLANPYYHWVSYHGLYDFGYIIKHLHRNIVPDNVYLFEMFFKSYFPTSSDVKVATINDSHLPHRGGLENLSSYFGCKRIGIQHQAGSDSAVTMEIFTKMIQNHEYRLKLENQAGLLFDTPSTFKIRFGTGN